MRHQLHDWFSLPPIKILVGHFSLFFYLLYSEEIKVFCPLNDVFRVGPTIQNYGIIVSIGLHMM